MEFRHFFERLRCDREYSQKFLQDPHLMIKEENVNTHNLSLDLIKIIINMMQAGQKSLARNL